jgi:predicted DCC family thiol-disulfide oxidoreductase YuxK
MPLNSYENLSSTHPLPEVETVATTPSWKIKLLYDGECPLCLREVNFLNKRDAGRGLVAFVDVADDNYDPEANGGVDFETAMGRIHAVLADGTVIKNVEVFRQVYEILGMGWVYAATKWPVIGPIVDRLYDLWADWRLALTGRPNLAAIAAERQQRLKCQPQGRCQLASDDV